MRWMAFAALLACGCVGIAGTESSTASVDASVEVREEIDAGPADAGGRDAGERDAGSTSRDAGATTVELDAGPLEPPPSTQWLNATGNLAGLTSDCRSLGVVASVPGSTRLLAAVAQQGVWSSDDRGASWQRLAGSNAITNRASSIVFDPNDPRTFWETGSYGTGLFVTHDDGATFTALGTMNMTQGVGVDWTDPQRQTVVASTHGPGVMLSTNGGQSFTDITATVPGLTFWVEVRSATRFLVGARGDPNAGVYRTNDRGATWERRSNLEPSHDGPFLRTRDGALFLPLENNVGLMKSTDDGETWSQVSAPGTPFAPPYVNITPLEMYDGSLVTIGATTLLRSTNGGRDWLALGEPFPWNLFGQFVGLTYVSRTGTFFLWHADCGTTVASDAIVSAGYRP